MPKGPGEWKNGAGYFIYYLRIETVYVKIDAAYVGIEILSMLV